MDYINILSVDPGTNMGVAIYTVSVPDLEILNIETTVLDLNVRTKPDVMYKNLLLRIEKIQLYISHIGFNYNPHILAMEAAFVNSRFPKSVMYLSQYIAAIELTLKNNNPFIKIFNYPPKLVKKTVNAGGKADKDMMTIAINNINEISNKIDPTRLSEHEVDALAVGYTLINELRNNPELLILL